MSEQRPLTTFSVGLSQPGNLAVQAESVQQAMDLAKTHSIPEDFDSPHTEPAMVSEEPGEDPEVGPDGRLLERPHVRVPTLPTPEGLGGRLRELRLALGLSIRDVAEQSSLTPSSISRLERGRTANLEKFQMYRQALLNIRGF